MHKETIAIAGAGTMGASIAQIYARHGHPVVVYDLYAEAIERAKGLIALHQETEVAEGRLAAEQSAALVAGIRFSTGMDAFKAADFVIEAIAEQMDVKKAFWAEASALVRPDALLTSNTSGLSITEMATAVHLPERFCGMHWINPPHLVPLVEVIKGEKTGDAAAGAVYQSALSVGKRPVMVNRDAKGFVLNRLQFAVLREAMHIVESGIASAEDVDNVFKYGLGMRYAAIGPFETADLGGLDIFYNIASYLMADLSDANAVPPMLAEAFAEGRYGVKSGRGFYDYADGKGEAAIRRRDRLFLALARCLYADGLGPDSEKPPE